MSAAAAPLAIVCGGGGFPLAVADAMAASGRRVFLIALSGIAAPDVARYPHEWVGLGQFGRFLNILKREGCAEVVFVGAVTRPSGWRDLIPDWGLLRRLPRVVKLFRGGDDHLLTGVARITEDAGFRVRGVHEVAPSILLGRGVHGRSEPSTSAENDIRFGFEILRALSPYDVGQGVVVAERRVIAVEAAEGTDAMLARVAELRRSGAVRIASGQGVFIKAPKMGQDQRMDLPALGPDTVRRVAEAGLAGIAALSGQVIVLEAEAMVAAADAAGVFIVGQAKPE